MDTNSKKLTINFPNPEFVFTELIEPGSTDNVVTWKFTGDKTDIVEVKAGCGCTAAFSINDDSITAIFSETSVKKNNGSNLSQGDRQKGKFFFKKSVTVYLNDGKPLKIKKGLNTSYNEVKKHIKLTFKGNVDVSDYPPHDPTPKKTTS